MLYEDGSITGTNITASDGINLKSLDALARKGAIPLCALRLLRQLRTNNKLKHEERLQLYTYLADAGMTYDDTLQLIKQNFCAGGKMTDDKFSKEYQYNIQHIYGLVGAKRRTHSSGCTSIIDNVPCTGFTYGCPFRSMNIRDIEDLVGQYIKCDVREAMNEVKPPMEHQAYHQACDHFFHSLFGVGAGSSNPAKYTQAALSIIKGSDQDMQQTQ